MHKNTLADIVIKSIRLANSVIDSSYEFPEMDIRTNNEITFRDNVLKYCNACQDNGKKEERPACTKNILEYAASLYDNNYGEIVAKHIQKVKRIQLIGHMFFFWKRDVKSQIKEALQRLENFYYECEARNDTAKELRAIPQKEFNEAMFEHWEELTVALEDVSKKETKRLLGKKSWE